MSIQVTCPAGHALKVAADWAGRAGLCPVCKAPIQVPGKPEEIERVEPSKGAATVATVSPASFNATRPLAAPPVRTRTHTKPLPPVPPRSQASADHRATPPKLLVEAAASPPPLPLPVLTVSASSMAAAAIDAALAIEEAAPEASIVAAAPAPESVVKAPPIPPARLRELESREEAGVAPSTQVTAFHEVAAQPGPIEAEKPRSRALRGYVPDADNRWTAYYLAAGMAAFSAFCLVPGLRYWNLAEAPDWARAVWLVSLLQLAFVAWAVSMPDWSTLWTSMIVLTVVATGYGLTMAVALTTPLDQAIPLDMTDIRRQAPLWCGCVVLLAFLLAYLCGRAAWRWRKTFELVHA